MKLEISKYSLWPEFSEILNLSDIKLCFFVDDGLKHIEIYAVSLSGNLQSKILRQCRSAKTCCFWSVCLWLAPEVPEVTYTPISRNKQHLKPGTKKSSV